MWPYARWPIEPMQAEPGTPKHGRPNKPMPPVYGTALPPRGVPGAIRRYAVQFPDHKPRYWLLRLLADRVESMSVHAKRYGAFVVPLVAATLVARKQALRAGT